ncbi:hypothetical protein GY45DRAFT_174886 [Cubamyces sp. BRFM 1775]|nr:hypothetical protein GY45DRAFT_174886 [Cubamyces sp. BRFM 1775]
MHSGRGLVERRSVTGPNIAYHGVRAFLFNEIDRKPLVSLVLSPFPGFVYHRLQSTQEPSRVGRLVAPWSVSADLLRALIIFLQGFAAREFRKIERRRLVHGPCKPRCGRQAVAHTFPTSRSAGKVRGPFCTCYPGMSSVTSRLSGAASALRASSRVSMHPR